MSATRFKRPLTSGPAARALNRGPTARSGSRSSCRRCCAIDDRLIDCVGLRATRRRQARLLPQAAARPLPHHAGAGGAAARLSRWRQLVDALPEPRRSAAAALARGEKIDYAKATVSGAVQSVTSGAACIAGGTVRVASKGLTGARDKVFVWRKKAPTQPPQSEPEAEVSR